jgi:hypothetical protein
MRHPWHNWAMNQILRFLLFTAKSMCLFLPTFLVIYVFGTILLTAWFGVLGGTPALVVSRDLAGIPILYYAFGIGWKVALMASLIVWACATSFAAIGKRGRGLLAWFVFLSVTGIACGYLATIPVLQSADFSSDGPPLASYFRGFIAVGWICGALLSPLWFFTYHRRLSP